MSYYQYLGYERRKTGFAVSLAEQIKNGSGLKPVLVNGKFGKDMPWYSDVVFSEYFATIPEGSTIDITKDFSGHITSVEIIEE